MGRSKRLKNLRKQVREIEAEYIGYKKDAPDKRWWHYVPIIGPWLYNRAIRYWLFGNRKHTTAVKIASRRAYQYNK
jgi:hypothetical protein